MQLKLQRSQRVGGLTSSTVFFCLDIRADYSAEERTNISRYKLGAQTIYNSRAARKHLDNAGAHLDQTQEGSAGKRALSLARGAAAMALAKMQLNISIASLGRGHHIECKDLEELLESEDTIRSACKSLTRYLQVAETFDGSEVVVEYVDGEEKVHIAERAPPLLEYSPAEAQSAAPTDPTSEPASSTSIEMEALTKVVRRVWDRFRQLDSKLQLIAVGAAVVIVFIALRSCAA